MKYLIGDKVKDKTKGVGEIIRIIFNSAYQDQEYQVRWLSDRSEQFIPCDQADRDWTAAPKFKATDLIKSKSTKSTGVIVEVGEDPFSGIGYYTIDWDSWLGSYHSYSFDIAHEDWDRLGGDSEEQQTKECFHEFTDYKGFTDNYKFCKKCDKKESY